MMPDWNNDGKQDWHDDYAINELIPNKNSETNAQSGLHIASSGCAVAVIVVIAILWGIINLLASI